MAARFEVVEAKPYHVGRMARALRRVHAEAIAAASPNVHRDLKTVADGSLFCRAWMIDGKLAGLGGVMGPMTGAVGQIWLALSDEATKHPVALIREARRQIAELMETRRALQTAVAERDAPSVLFAHFLGFKDDPAPPIDINGVKFFPLTYKEG